MSPSRAAAAATLLAALALTTCTQYDNNQEKEFYVTAVIGGSGGEWASETLQQLAAARLRQQDVPAHAVSPPPACRTNPLSWQCQNDVLSQFVNKDLVAAMLPLPIAQNHFPSSYELFEYGIVDVGDAIEQPLRLQCAAPPPARSLLDLADPAVAAHYPPPPHATPLTTCTASACAALLVTDLTEANRTSTFLERHQILAQVYLLDKKDRIDKNFLKNQTLVVCDFAPELGLTLPESWRYLGPPPCDTIDCPFEGRRLAKLVNIHAVLGTLRTLRLLREFKVDIRNLRELCDHARQNNIDKAVSKWLETHWNFSQLQEIRSVALVPDASCLDDAYQRRSLAVAAALAESKAPINATALFKVEVQVKCSPEDASAYLDSQLKTGFGQMSAIAGPALSTAWRELAHTSSAQGLPMLAYTTQTAPGGPALLAAGTLQDEAAALGAWAAAQGWHRLALLAPADHARDAAPALLAHLAVNVALDDPRPTPNWELIEQWVKRAAVADARILYVWSENMRVVAGAICIASRYKLTPERGVVWLLPPLSAAALSAAAAAAPAAARCHVAPLLDGHFTVAPAWRAAWEGWDTSTAQLPSPHALKKDWKEQCSRDNKTRKDTCAWPPPAAAALLYDLLCLWIRAVDRVITATPYASDNLHQSGIVRNIIANATEHEYTGLTGKFKWRAEKENAWARISVMVVAQWDGANATWRQVAAWNGSVLQERAGVVRWRTADGRAPDDGDVRCALAAAARALRVSCAAAWALAALLAAGAAAALLAAAALRWRRRAERSFRRRLAALGLHALPAGADRWEVPRERVVINRKLGTGAFGTVYGGHALLGERGWSAVAVKTLKPGASTEEKLDFLAEAEAMKRLDHKNIVRLLGVVTKTEPVCTVMEFMLYGDLKTYLLARRHVADECEVGARRLTAMALDAARALSYLAEQRWVHRDVAARNCLVSARRVLKLADFGMARRVYDGDYYRLRRRSMLPVRWMAPEALAAGEFSAASDVWALGVLLYEMVTLGALPFAGLSNAEVLARVQAGRALEPPPGVTPPLEALLRACWAARAGARPLAAEVAAFLAEQPRLVAPCCPPPLDALPLAHAHHAHSLWRAHDAPGSAATDTTYLSDARDTDRFLPDDLAL